jgi:streptomycin 6-kinase
MIEIPRRLLDNWREWYPERGAAVAAEIGERAQAAIRAWGLAGARPIGGGEVALVLEAGRDGAAVICKLSPPDPSLGDEAAGLAAWAGRCICPELLDARDGGRTMLMERLDPGTPLAFNVGSVDEELRIIGALVRELHRAPAPAVPHLAGSALATEWTEALDDEADRAELGRLLGDDEVVAHTDLHANNVLRHGGGWRVIDPKPFRAGREAEVWGLVDATGLPDETKGAADEMRRRLRIYCEAAGLDQAKAHRWARIRARAGVELAPPGSEWKAELVRVAAALD